MHYCSLVSDCPITKLKSQLVEDVKISGSFGSSDQKTVDFRSLRAVRKARSRLETMGFRRPDAELFRELAGRILQEPILKGKGAQET